MGKLDGKVIAVTGPRCAEEFGRIVGKMGGEPLVVPAQGNVYSDDRQLEEQLRQLLREPADWLVLTTGTGTDALLLKADELGLRDEWLTAMSEMRIAARGYKTVNALRRILIEPDVKADDGTTDGLFRELSAFPLQGARIALQLYGDPSPRLVRRLREAGADCVELMPYVHVMPDAGPIEDLIRRCLQGTVQAVVFTSTAQVRCVFEYARQFGVALDFAAALERDVAVAAVGKITAEALREEGVFRVLYPEEERLGPTLVMLGRWYEAQTSAAGAYVQ